jgi:hypothetical protein
MKTYWRVQVYFHTFLIWQHELFCKTVVVNLWETKWYGGQFFSEFFGLALSVIPPVLCIDFSYHKLGHFEAAVPGYIVSVYSINKKYANRWECGSVSSFWPPVTLM